LGDSLLQKLSIVGFFKEYAFSKLPMKTPSTLSSVVLWSVISAAFIGPGSVTAAVAAGSQFQIQLLWSVVFATIGCIVLQEVSARITIVSGLTLGQAIDLKFGRYGKSVKLFSAIPVVLGCAAYETGNILGAVSGVSVLFEGDFRIYTIIVTAVAACILWRGGSKWISWLMAIMVVMMGVAFLMLALRTHFSFLEITIASVVPSVPPGSEWLTLGLVGTTIVPYNIFIGSAIGKGQTVSLMRIGLVISIIMGGLITVFILLGGTLVQKFSSFAELSSEFQAQMGYTGTLALGIGLFAAGFSSAIMAPYASSLIATTVFNVKNKNKVRLIWGSVLLTGFAFGISGVNPVQVILAVQALNGLLLPLLTYFLILVVNDHIVVPKDHHPSPLYNGALLIILFVTTLIGLNNLDVAISKWFSLASQSHFTLEFILTAVITIMAGIQLWRLIPRKKMAEQ